MRCPLHPIYFSVAFMHLLSFFESNAQAMATHLPFDSHAQCSCSNHLIQSEFISSAITIFDVVIAPTHTFTLSSPQYSPDSIKGWNLESESAHARGCDGIDDERVSMRASAIYTSVKISPIRVGSSEWMRARSPPRASHQTDVESDVNAYCVWYLFLLLLRFPFRRLFKFIYVKIKLNASRNRFEIGADAGTDASQPLNYELAVGSVEVFFSIFCANTIACWINFETASQSQTISMRDKHTCANAYALWMGRIDYINI